jgi:formylglycine-generating enzyme required for sulfatase activity
MLEGDRWHGLVALLAAVVACARSERNDERRAAPIAATSSATVARPVHGASSEPRRVLSRPDGTVRIAAGQVSDCWSREYRTEGDCARKVVVNSFHLDATEVTVSAYRGCIRAGACAPPALKEVDQRWLCTWVKHEERGNVPMTCVTFEEAQGFCAWNGRRLPTLHEWLHALRMDHPRPYLWDGAPPGTEQVFALGPCWGQSAPCKVPHWPPSQAGPRDLVGNVAEWVNAHDGAWVAGVSWTDPDPHDMNLLRVDRATRATPSARGFRTGFRCALTPTEGD